MGRFSDQVDGVGIENHAAAISGTFDVDYRDAVHMAYDDEVMVVLVGRVKLPRFKEAANGDVTRVAVLKVRQAAVILNRDQQAELAEQYDLDYQTPLPYTGPAIPVGARTAVAPVRGTTGQALMGDGSVRTFEIDRSTHVDVDGLVDVPRGDAWGDDSFEHIDDPELRRLLEEEAEIERLTRENGLYVGLNVDLAAPGSGEESDLEPSVDEEAPETNGSTHVQETAGPLLVDGRPNVGGAVVRDPALAGFLSEGV